MIRLVQQFDSLGTRPQVASPKSSACSCCCCCCVATVLTSGVLTARAIGRVPALTAPLYDLTAPETTTETTTGTTTETTTETTPPSTMPPPSGPPLAPPAPAVKRSLIGWKVLGFFLLPIALVVSAIFAQFTPNHMGAVVGCLLFLGSYVGGLFMLRHQVGFHGGWILGLLVGLPFAVAAEVALWFLLVFH